MGSNLRQSVSFSRRLAPCREYLRAETPSKSVVLVNGRRFPDPRVWSRDGQPDGPPLHANPLRVPNARTWMSTWLDWGAGSSCPWMDNSPLDTSDSYHNTGIWDWQAWLGLVLERTL